MYEKASAKCTAAMASTNWRVRAAGPPPSPPPPAGSAPQVGPATPAGAAPATHVRSQTWSGPRTKYVVGQVVHLPAFESIDPSSVCLKSESDRGAYGHPAVVTSIRDNGNLGVMVITSLGEQPLAGKWKGKPDESTFVNAYLYIAGRGSEVDSRFRHPNPGMLELTIAGKDNLEKPSYVRYDREIEFEPHLMKFASVRGRQMRDLHLSPESTIALTSKRNTIPRLPFGHYRRFSDPASPEQARSRLSSSSWRSTS